jgi:hypothetical protein
LKIVSHEEQPAEYVNRHPRAHDSSWPEIFLPKNWTMQTIELEHTEARTASSSVLLVICLGYFMVIVDTTVVNVALPAIDRDLHGGVSGLQWAVDAYTLSFAGLLLTGGALAERLGGRRIFGAGLGSDRRHRRGQRPHRRRPAGDRVVSADVLVAALATVLRAASVLHIMCESLDAHVAVAVPRPACS